MVGIAEDSVQLRSFRTLPTFPAWSSTTCLRRAPSFLEPMPTPEK